MTQAVDWNMLASLQAAGYTSQGIANLDAAQKAGAPVPTPAQANQPGYTPVKSGGVTSAPAGVDNSQRSAEATLTAELNSWGLGSLKGQVMDQIAQGVDATTVGNFIRTTPEYAKRFPGMAALSARGEGISEGDYINYESELASTAAAAGLPPGFYDQPDDFTNFIANGVSAQEYKDRINQGFSVVAQAPPEIRSEFGKLFGAQGDSALAAYFLDPSKAMPLLTQQISQAQFAGEGDRFGFGTTAHQSLSAAQLGITDQQAQQGFQALDKNAGLFTNQLGDRDNVTKETGVNAQFGLEAGAQQQVDQRLKQRLAQFQGATNSPETEQTGSSGFGTATT